MQAGQRRKQYQAEVGVYRHRFRVPRSGSPGSNSEITNSRMNNAQKCQPGQEQDFAVFAWKCAALMCEKHFPPPPPKERLPDASQNWDTG